MTKFDEPIVVTYTRDELVIQKVFTQIIIGSV